VLGFRFELAPVAEEARPPVFRYLMQSLRDYVGSRPLLLLFGVYTLWYCALSVTTNLSLYTKHVLNRDPREFSGLIMALRFGCKAAGGYFLGVVALRWGLRASAVMCSVLLAAGTLWGWLTPGYAFLLAFGFLGAGELGGAYIPNLGMALSRPEATARNISLLTLASTVSSFSPPLFGYLADHFGFGVSFTYGLAMAVAAIWLTTRIEEPEVAATTAA
jgi:MFS family permease